MGKPRASFGVGVGYQSVQDLILVTPSKDVKEKGARCSMKQTLSDDYAPLGRGRTTKLLLQRRGRTHAMFSVCIVVAIFQVSHFSEWQPYFGVWYRNMRDKKPPRYLLNPPFSSFER